VVACGSLRCLLGFLAGDRGLLRLLSSSRSVHFSVLLVRCIENPCFFFSLMQLVKHFSGSGPILNFRFYSAFCLRVRLVPSDGPSLLSLDSAQMYFLFILGKCYLKLAFLLSFILCIVYPPLVFVPSSVVRLSLSRRLFAMGGFCQAGYIFPPIFSWTEVFRPLFLDPLDPTSR